MIIKDIKAREIFDSRGLPTVETDIITDAGTFSASVPSGASTGIFEAVELRDGDKDYMQGKGVQRAVNNIITEIKSLLIGKDVRKQFDIDHAMIELDGSKNEWGFPKSRLGANAILSVSIAVCRAAAKAENLPLYRYIANLAGVKEDKLRIPIPCLNVINGGVHAGNQLAMQEFMVIPSEAKTFKEAMVVGSEIYQTLKGILRSKFGPSGVNVGDEGGFAPDVNSAEEALDLLMEAIEKAGYKNKAKIAMDPAASEFFDAKAAAYDLHFKSANKGKNTIKTAQLLDYYKDLVKKYPIVSIEDCFEQNDHSGFKQITASMGKNVQIVGDDLLVTNVKRIEMALLNTECNALLLKINQIGTITEAISAYQLAKKNNWGVMVSHRSGDTEDSFIADLVVGLNTGQLKCGAPCRGERTAKYNRLIRIEEELGSQCYYDRTVLQR